MKNDRLGLNMFRRGLRMAAAGSLATVLFAGSTIAADKTLVLVGTSLTLAPLSFINEKGENVGFELDILDAIGEKLNYNFQYVRVPFSQNFTSLNSGVFRVSAAAAFMTCERLKNPAGVGQFSVPTYTAGQAISTKAEMADKIKSTDDFAGKKIGIESVGSTADKIVTALGEKSKFEKVVFADNPSLFLALEQGRIDAAIQGEFSAAWQSRGNDNIKIAGRITSTYFPVGFVFRNGDPMRDEFNKTINELKKDGSLAKIYKKWFTADPPADSPTANVVPVVTPESRGC